MSADGRPLEILIAVHQLPPAEVGGVGTFTVNLAAELGRRGHRVTLLAGAERPAEGPTTLTLEAPACAGIPTYRLRRAARRGALDRFVGTFSDRRTEALVGGLIRRLAPDVLHVQHTLHLSARLCGLGRAAGAAVVATVHDYWPICQRIDLRRAGAGDEGGEICEGPLGGLRCAACLEPPGGAAGRGLPGLPGLVRRAAARGARIGPCLLRTQIVQGGYASAHRITVPSRYVAEVLQRAGFDPRRLVLVDYGIPPLPAGVAARPRPRRPFCFGYLGTLGPHKGAWVPLRAARLLPEGDWRVELHGGPLRDPELRRQIDRACAEGRAVYRGTYGQAELPGILAGLDALIIPSLWPETGPMVWMEALAAGLPVIGSRLGALPERIHHDVDGLLVRPGDAAELSRAMSALMASYGRLRLGALQRPVRTVADAARELDAVYREALAARAPRR